MVVDGRGWGMEGEEIEQVTEYMYYRVLYECHWMWG